MIQVRYLESALSVQMALMTGVTQLKSTGTLSLVSYEHFAQKCKELLLLLQSEDSDGARWVTNFLILVGAGWWAQECVFLLYKAVLFYRKRETSYYHHEGERGLQGDVHVLRGYISSWGLGV